MKIKLLCLLFALCAAGCSKDSAPDVDVNEDPRVLLPVKSLKQRGKVRSAVDKWEETEVGLAYRTTSPLYTDHLSVVIEAEADQVIDTGMEYPLDGSPVSVTGFYPAKAPQSTGLVTYDISKGDIDLMCSNEVSGTQTSTIIGSGVKLQFKHLMTRLTFTMQCAPGQTYPERIAGVLIGGVRTYASLNLATRSVYYTIPGIVYVGHPDGYYVPASYEDKLVIDAIIQPGAPITVDVITVNDNVTSVTFSALNFLTTTGGAAGQQYLINLTFNGTSILADQVSVVEWEDGGTMPNLPGGSTAWW